MRSWLPAFAVSVVVALTRLLASDAKNPDSRYYHDGPLAGSLKSSEPLPLYDEDSNHLWNRVFAALYIRPGEEPPPGQPRRIEGGDAYLDPLIWPETTYFSEPETFARTSKVLDKFVQQHAETLIRNPLKRALFQHDLWAVFYRLQQQGNFGGKEATPRRKTLCGKLAAIIKAVALSREEIRELPRNYPLAVQSGRFVADHQFDPKRDYLPTDLPIGPGNSISGDWVEITNPGNAPPYHTHDFGGRSYFRIFHRFPGGRKAVEDYLKYVAEEGAEIVADMPQIPGHRRARLKGAGREAAGTGPSIRQIPAGTQLALLRQMVVLDQDLKPVPTSIVEDLRMRIFKNVEGKADPATTSGEGVNIHAYELKRALAFDGWRDGGLERQPNDSRVYRPLFHFAPDWGRPQGREGLGFLMS